MKPILQRTNQFMEQTVALGCMIISNPESTITWSKLNQTVVMEDEALNRSENVYTEIDATNSKYQIHKHKQINQTVSYLKIKVDIFVFNKKNLILTNTLRVSKY